MDYSKMAAVASKLLSPDLFGKTAILRKSTSVRAATGGAITKTDTDYDVVIAVVSDVITVVDSQTVKKADVYLSGADPSVGDILFVEPDEPRRIEAVMPIRPSDITVAYQLTVI